MGKCFKFCNSANPGTVAGASDVEYECSCNCSCSAEDGTVGGAAAGGNCGCFYGHYYMPEESAVAGSSMNCGCRRCGSCGSVAGASTNGCMNGWRDYCYRPCSPGMTAGCSTNCCTNNCCWDWCELIQQIVVIFIALWLAGRFIEPERLPIITA